MKRIFAIATILVLIVSLSLCCFAADVESVTEPEASADVTAPAEQPELTEPAEQSPITAPTEQQVQQGVTDFIDKVDGKLSGVEMWETAKAWVLENLSTVVGVITAISMLTAALATKFSFIPKIIGKVQQFGTAVGQWYEANTESVKNMKNALAEFIGEMRKIIDTVAAQSAENKELREQNAELMRECIRTKQEYNAINTQLLEYAKIMADEFEDLLQTSDLTKADLDAHYDAYRQKIALIEAVQPEAETEGSETA